MITNRSLLTAIAALENEERDLAGTVKRHNEDAESYPLLYTESGYLTPAREKAIADLEAVRAALAELRGERDTVPAPETELSLEGARDVADHPYRDYSEETLRQAYDLISAHMGTRNSAAADRDRLRDLEGVYGWLVASNRARERQAGEGATS